MSKISTLGNKLNTLDDVCKAAVARIGSVSGVRQILLLETGEEPVILTVVSETPFLGKVRERVYRAQVDILRSVARPLVRFDLVNIQELGPARSTAVPAAARELWSPASHA